MCSANCCKASEDKAKPPASQELQAKKADVEGSGMHRQSEDDATHSDEEKASSHKKSGEPGKDDTRSRDSDKESDDKRPLEDKLSALEKKKREAQICLRMSEMGFLKSMRWGH